MRGAEWGMAHLPPLRCVRAYHGVHVSGGRGARHASLSCSRRPGELSRVSAAQLLAPNQPGHAGRRPASCWRLCSGTRAHTSHSKPPAPSLTRSPLPTPPPTRPQVHLRSVGGRGDGVPAVRRGGGRPGGRAAAGRNVQGAEGGCWRILCNVLFMCGGGLRSTVVCRAIAGFAVRKPWVGDPHCSPSGRCFGVAVPMRSSVPRSYARCRSS